MLGFALSWEKSQSLSGECRLQGMQRSRRKGADEEDTLPQCYWRQCYIHPAGPGDDWKAREGGHDLRTATSREEL